MTLHPAALRLRVFGTSSLPIERPEPSGVPDFVPNPTLRARTNFLKHGRIESFTRHRLGLKRWHAVIGLRADDHPPSAKRDNVARRQHHGSPARGPVVRNIHG